MTSRSWVLTNALDTWCRNAVAHWRRGGGAGPAWRRPGDGWLILPSCGTTISPAAVAVSSRRPALWAHRRYERLHGRRRQRQPEMPTSRGRLRPSHRDQRHVGLDTVAPVDGRLPTHS